MTLSDLPHRPEVRAASIAAIVGYAGFSVWAIFYGDPAMKGDVIGTWKSFAVLAFGFWLGSSSGGKSQSADQSKQIGDLTEATRELAKSVPNAGGEPDVTLQPGQTAQAAPATDDAGDSRSNA